MKKFKNLFIMLFIFIFLFIGMNAVSAAKGDTLWLQYDTHEGDIYKFSSSPTYSKDTDIGASSSYFYFFRYASTQGNTSGKQIFCLDPNSDATAAYIYTSLGEKQSCAVIEALKAGAITTTELNNASSDLAQTGSANYHKVQNVLWRYLKTYNTDSTSCSKTVGSTGSISASAASEYLTLSTDGTKYISKAITVTRNNLSNYQLSTTISGAYLATNSDGTGQITGTTTASTVYLVLPSTTDISSDISITLKGDYSLTNYSGFVEIFSAGSSHQRMGKIRGGVTTTPYTVTAKLSFDATGIVRIAKVDAKNNRIAGAKLKVTVEGVEKETITTTTNYKKYTDIPIGSEVCIEEVSAPYGYVKNKTKKCGTVKTDETLTLTIANSKTKVLISKLDATSEKELPGATLSILDSDKKQIDLTAEKYKNVEIIDGDFIEGKGISWVSKETSTEIQGLPIGTYYLQEDIAPAGYDREPAMVKIKITEDGVSTNASIKNSLTVKVPNTGLNSKIFIIIGLNLIIIGAAVVFFVTRKRKKECK